MVGASRSSSTDDGCNEGDDGKDGENDAMDDGLDEKLVPRTGDDVGEIVPLHGPITSHLSPHDELVPDPNSYSFSPHA